MGVESGAIEMGPALSSLSMGSYRGARAHPDCTANTACARKRANGRCGAAGESRATWGCYMRSQGRGVGWLGRNARRSEPRLMCVALARGCKSFWLRRTRPPSLWAGKKGGSRYGTVYFFGLCHTTVCRECTRLTLTVDGQRLFKKVCFSQITLPRRPFEAK